MSLSFGTNTIDHRFNQLIENAKTFKSDILNIELAVRLAQDSWMLVDIVHSELKESKQLPKFKDFRDQIKSDCPELGYMQDIANESKHGEITHYAPVLKETKRHNGSFSQSFSRDFDISHLQLTTTSGQILWFEDILEAVICFWNQTLDNLHAKTTPASAATEIKGPKSNG